MAIWSCLDYRWLFDLLWLVGILCDGVDWPLKRRPGEPSVRPVYFDDLSMTESNHRDILNLVPCFTAGVLWGYCGLYG